MAKTTNDPDDAGGEPTSAATRLYTFLTAARAAVKAGSASLDAVLSRVLSIPQGNLIELYRAYAAITDLANDAVNEIHAALPVDGPGAVPADMAQVYSKTARAVYSKLLKGHVAMPAGQLTELPIEEIRMAALYVLREPREQTPGSEVLGKARIMVEEVKASVTTSDLPEALKVELTDRLATVLDAIDHYHIFGLRGLVQATAMAQASVASAIPTLSKDQAQAGKGLMERIADVTTIIVNTILLSQFAIAGAPHLAKLLPGN